MTPKELLDMPLYRDSTLRGILRMYAIEGQFDPDDVWPEGSGDGENDATEPALFVALAQKLIDAIKKD